MLDKSLAENLSSLFSFGSSPVDWCETNYVHSLYIAEYFNTLSNIPMVVLPLLGLYFNRSYFNHVTPSAKWAFVVYAFVGLSSAYYHATLSLFGQLLDELGILYVLIVGHMVWFPSMRFWPEVLKQRQRLTRTLFYSLSVVCSILSFLNPAVNAYALMIVGVTLLVRLAADVVTSDFQESNELGVICGAVSGAAISIWLSDRTMCPLWQKAGAPYAHAVWHVLCAYGGYSSQVLCSFLDAKAKAARFEPVIDYFPPNFGPLKLVPYVKLTNVNNETSLIEERLYENLATATKRCRKNRL